MSDGRFGDLSTEQRHAASRDLDLCSSEKVVALLVEEDRKGIETVLEHRARIAIAAEWLADSLVGGGRAVLAGAGTSGRLAVLEAAECPPTFGTEPEQIQAVIAGGPGAVFEAREGAEDREEDGREAVADVGARDLVLAISASSVTPFVRGALEEGRRRGARTVLLTCAVEDDVTTAADLVVALATGPEILTGSTRLKAGSATKAALNAMTTAAMVRAGKVFENFMVDLRPGSKKLEDRALRILEGAGKVTRSEAARLYALADGELKTAIVMARRGDTPEEARERLHKAAGSIRRTLDPGAVFEQ